MNKTPYPDFSSIADAVNSPAIIDFDRPVWIFGAGNFGCTLYKAMSSRGIKVSGFVETIPLASSTLDLPVIDWATLAKRSDKVQLALGIFNRAAPFDELAALAFKAGFDNVLMPWDTYDIFFQELGWRFWLSRRDFLLSALDRIKQVAERVADRQSYDILLRVAAFRLGLDISFASFQSPERQYFNEITLPPLQGKSITYVDCGAYNGDTYTDLASQPGTRCLRAYLLEPDPKNFAELVKNLENHKSEAICLPLAAGDKYQTLKFSSGQGEGGALGISGDIHVATIALDQMLGNNHVDCIKMDVEGAEDQVLQGARRIINNCRPVLAMSLYHNPQDLWYLPELLFDICMDYDIYIRQHCFNSFDLVLYAIPRSD